MSHDEAGINPGTASTMLRLGLGQHRPLDRLISRLSAADGESWLEQSLSWGPMSEQSSPREVLLSGSADPARLMQIKERSKAMVRSAATNDGQLAGIAGYFLAVAAALRWHGTLIANRSRLEVAESLLDLAAVAPPSYQDMLGKAAAMLRSATG